MEQQLKDLRPPGNTGGWSTQTFNTAKSPVFIFFPPLFVGWEHVLEPQFSFLQSRVRWFTFLGLSYELGVIVYGRTWHTVGLQQPQECTHFLGTAIKNVRRGFFSNDRAARGEPWLRFIEQIVKDFAQFDKKKNFKAYFRVQGILKVILVAKRFRL